MIAHFRMTGLTDPQSKVKFSYAISDVCNINKEIAPPSDNAL